MEQRKEPLSSLHEQRVRARIIMAHAETEDQGSNVAFKDELVLYDFPKDFNGIAKNEIRLRIGDDKTPINNLSDLVLDNMNFYDSKPDYPEVGDVWYDKAEKTFYLGTGEGSIKLSHIIENVEDGLGDKSIQTAGGSSVAYGNYSVALGNNNQSGAKGFKISGKNNTAKSYTLDTENINNIAVGDKFSIVLTNNYDFQGIITQVDTDEKTITVDNFVNEEIIDTGSNYLLLYEKPDAGDYIIGTGAIASGNNTKALGYGAHAEGYNTNAAGKYSHTEGNSTTAGYAAHAEGNETIALGQNSHTEGHKTKAIGWSAHAEGNESFAEGNSSHAEGYNTEAKAQAAHAEGYQTHSSKLGAHAEGQDSSATGQASHAEGSGTIASDGATHAEGAGTKASSYAAHAEGSNTIAKNNSAHAEGVGTITSTYGQHVQGKYNKEDNKQAHIVGGGNSEEERKNIHTLDWDGNAWYAGGIEAKQGIFKSTEGTVNLTNGYITASNNIQAGKEIKSTEIVSEEIYNTETIYTKKINVDSEIDARNARIYANDIDIGNAGIGEAGNIYGSSLSIKDYENNNVVFINNEGHGRFETLTLGQNNYPVLNYVGAGETLPSVANEGDIFRIPSQRVEETRETNVYCSKDMETGWEYIGFEKYYILYQSYCEYNIGEVVGLGSALTLKATAPQDITTNNFIEFCTNLSMGEYFYIRFNNNLYEAMIYLIDSSEYGEVTITGGDINFEELISSEYFEFKKKNDSTEIDNIQYGIKSNYNSLTKNTLFNYIFKLIKSVYPISDQDIINNKGNMIELLPNVQFTSSWVQSDIPFVITKVGMDRDGYYYIEYDINGLSLNKLIVDYSKISRPTLTALNLIYYSKICYYIYNKNFGWEALGNNFNNSVNNIEGSGLLPIIGYEDFCKYQVTDKSNTEMCFNQACLENPKQTIYILNGEYEMENDHWSAPDVDNIHLIGLGQVVLNFSVSAQSENEYGMTNINSWTLENIIFNKSIGLTYFGLANGGAYGYSGTAINCIFKDKVEISLSGSTSTIFKCCDFYNNILCSGDQSNSTNTRIEYDNCNFYISSWDEPIIQQLYLTSMVNCNLYFDKQQKELVLGKSSIYFNPETLKNNTYYLKGFETEFLSPHWMEGVAIKYSAFPWNGLKASDKELSYEIDEETCYINNKPIEEKEELLIQDIDKDFIQNVSSLDKVVIEDVGKIERSPTTIALVSGTVNTPDGNRFDRYKLWKENKNFSYLEQITGGFIQGSNHFILGPNFVTGSGHLATGVLHTIEGAGNTIGGVEDGIPDIQLRANHAEGINNILPSEYGEHQFRIPLARHIEGFGNIGNSVAGSHVQGYYCLKDENNKYIHIVGNGEDDENRSNAQTLDKEGNAWFAGGLTLTNEHYPVIHYRDENNAFPQDNLTFGQMFNLTNFSSDLADEIELADEDKVINDTLQINNTIIKKYLLETFGYLLNTNDFINYQITTIMPTLKFQTSSEILEFKNIYNINNDENNFNLTYKELVITNLNGDITVSQNYIPNDNGEILLVNKKIKVLGVFNSLNEKYEAGLYLRTSDNTDWKKLSVFTKNTNQDSPGSTPGGENPQNRLLIIKPTNGAYNFDIDLSTYGIKLGDIINFVCIGAGGAGGGVSSTKKGGDAGSYGYSSSSSSGGAPGTGFGAGGGGSSANSTSSSYYGGSGGGSGYVVMGGPHIVNNLTVNVTLGKAGTGGSGAGGDGGDTIFLGTTAKGGEGGLKGGASKSVGGQGGKEGHAGSLGNISKSGGNGGNGWVPSNYNPESETISVYGAIANDNVPTYSGDGAIFIWY